MKVILFSPVRTANSILIETLASLRDLQTPGWDLEMWFYDDNDDVASSETLDRFVAANPTKRKLLPRLDIGRLDYERTERTHTWRPDNVDRVIQLKNLGIRHFLESGADSLFLLDADTVLHPSTLAQLVRRDLPIVAEVCWTKFSPDYCYLPNLWDVMSYGHRNPERVLRLRDPGLYRVGGLSACTLVQREPLASGLNFSRIENVDFWGEDRHFCIRAAALGIPLHGDTHYPAYHVYRLSQVAEARRWREAGAEPSFFRAWLDRDWEECIRNSFIPSKTSLWRSLRQAIKPYASGMKLPRVEKR